MPRVGLVGCGYWGKHYCRLLPQNARTGQIQFTGVTDEDPRTQAWLKDQGHPVVPLDALIDGSDAVVVVTPASTHASVVERLLREGKHVLLEKPMTLDVASSERLCALAAEAGVVLMVGHTFLFNSAYERMKELVAQPAFGRLHYMYSRRTNLGPIRPDTSCLWDLAPHDVSMFLALHPAPVEWVSAVGWTVDHGQPSGGSDVVFLTIGFKDAIAHVQCSWCDPHKVREVVVVGSGQRLCFDDTDTRCPLSVFQRCVGSTEDNSREKNLASMHAHMTLRDGDILYPSITSAEPLMAQLKHFLALVEGGESSRSPPEFGLAVVRVLAAADESIKQGGSRIPLGMSISPSASLARGATSPRAACSAPVVLIGHGAQACDALRALRSSLDVVVVVCEPSDDGVDGWRPSLRKLAESLGYDLGRTLFAANPNRAEVVAACRAAKPALLVSVQCRALLKPELLSVARAVNLHNAPLPLLRGCDPFSWAVHDGLQEFGVSLHAVDDGVDTGPVYAQRRWKIKSDATAWSIYQESLKHSAAMIGAEVPRIARDADCKPEAQDERYATYHPQGQFDFRTDIDWSAPCHTVSAFVRSRIFPPFQCPTAHARLLRVRAVPDAPKGKPGTVVSAAPLRVACGRGALEIATVMNDKGGSADGSSLGFAVGDDVAAGRNIPLVDIQANYRALKKPIDAGIKKVVDSCWFIGGPVVDEFEAKFARFVGVDHCVGVNSGTDALYLAYHFLGFEGAEVVVQANTFVATLLGLSRVKAKIVLCDVGPDHQLSLAELKRRVTPQTKAVVVVHMHGHMCSEMEGVMALSKERGFIVIEDACQAHGARLGEKRAGSFGHVGCFSFYPGKNLGAFGDGGALCTNDSALATKVRYWRAWGAEKKYHHTVKGGNSRLDAVQAAVLLAKLEVLDTLNARRRELAARYRRLLPAAVELPPVPAGVESVWHLFVVTHADRDGLVQHLNDRGIGAGIHYPIPLHRLDAYTDLADQGPAVPAADALSKRILSLPIYPEMTDAQHDRVCAEVRAFVEARA